MDREQNVYLIEVNNNPCLEESNAYLSELLERMIEDTLGLTIDRIYGEWREKN